MTLMPSVDIRTLILLLGLGNLLLFLSLKSFRFVHEDHQSGVSQSWAYSKLLQSVAWMLLWMRGEIPPLWSIEIGNTLLLAGFGLESLAAWQFATRRRPSWLLLVVVGVVLARYPLNQLGGDSPEHRVVVASLMSAGLFGLTGFALVHLRAERSRLQYFVGGSTLLLAAVVLLRGIFAALPAHSFGLLDNNGIQVATFLALFLLMLTNGYGVVLLDKERTGEVLRALAMSDSLTGVNNRRAFFQRLRTMAASAHRNGYPLSVLSIDLDYFKQINDSHGHAAGDAVLINFARRCEASVREVDVIGRIGGEEFAVAMNGADANEAARVAERLRAEIAALPLAILERPRALISTTISIGLATMYPGESLDNLMARADAALYRAKRSGRNRVRIDDTPAPPQAPTVAAV
ncbi:GGDEF domain-containing protein [Azoarcus sp. L1K30]|uniref:GGDEF domain-containing protein n=1 Tax=Azoarcus sp. L1K30 TaxID=2820277 RepID=UPI001B838998|nr:GGDEF domain-containing protein [Azoarcus sp. L1K30]MBR0568738.1 GGDEF domain-containing protein [Azoarcus sp. L1K30]